MSARTRDDILAEVQDKQIRYIELQFTDILGIVKSTTIPVGQLPGALDQGVWFDGSSVEGFARIAESDMYLKPDFETFAILPWRSGPHATARFICDVYTPNNQVFVGDPRAVLKRALVEAEKMGFIFNTGPELEFLLLKRHPDGSIIPPLPVDSDGYFDIPTDEIGGLRYEVAQALESFGIVVEAMHAEVSHGQHEIDFRYSDALTTANNAVTFRVALKIIARQHNLHATFLPKPIRGTSGNGMHVHQSLVYKSTGVNAFADPGDQYGLSQTAKHFIAGQLHHARGMCGVLSPLVNSYKRLVAGYEAPVYVSWGRINRSALIRVPRAHDLESTRVEFRSPDPSCNPYLAFAVMLAAGLDGIRREMPLIPPSEENLYLPENQLKQTLPMLPATLEDALNAMEEDKLIREALGTQVFERFVQAKRQEWDDYRLEITNWELNKYLNSY